MDFEGYTSVGQVATELGVSEATVWNLIRQHELDRYKFPGNRKTWIARDDIAKLKQPIKLGSPQRGRPRGTGEAAKKAAA